MEMLVSSAISTQLTDCSRVSGTAQEEIMDKARTLGSDWIELSSDQTSSPDHKEISRTNATPNEEHGAGDILEGLRYALLLSSILWAGLIVTGLLILG
jgi:hypothetical protein